MKKKRFVYGKFALGAIAISAIACSIAWKNPTIDSKETSIKKSNEERTISASSEEVQLVALLEADGLISQFNGFVVEKRQNALFVNGKQLPENISARYTSKLQKDDMRIIVQSFSERQKQHPDASFIQVLLPVSLSSPCVKYTPPKDGC